MFNRYRREREPENIIDNFPAAITETELLSSFTEEERQLEPQPEIVEVVEKISIIFSPYFFVLVGLVLYRENFYLANALILLGTISLLKISWRDVSSFFNGFKNILGLGSSSDDTFG